MEVRFEDTPQGQKITIDGGLSVFEYEEYLSEIINQITKDHLTICFEYVDEFDTAGLQFLLALKLKYGKTICLHRVPEQHQPIMKLLRLNRYFEFED